MAQPDFYILISIIILKTEPPKNSRTRKMGLIPGATESPYARASLGTQGFTPDVTSSK